MNARLPSKRLRLPPVASWALTLVTAVLASSCYSAAGGDPEFWAPLPGESGLGGAGGTSGLGGSSASTNPASTASGADPSTTTSAGSGAQTATSSSASTGTGQPTGMPKLTVDFTTVTFKGQYAPKNVGAVWITNDQDVFVKTLERWAVKRSKYLVKWKAASNANVVDAVTGATRSQHGPHSLSWDGTDVSGDLVPDGTYRVYMEFTEKNGAGPWTSIDVVKGASPADITPANLAAFTGQHVTYTP
jgi:hypothetical protein